jgi:hypothetical protein
MDILPENIENIILNYKNDLETYHNHKTNYKKSLDIINNMIYKITNNKSGNITSHRIVKYKNSYYMFNKSCNELFSWTGFSTF